MDHQPDLSRKRVDAPRRLRVSSLTSSLFFRSFFQLLCTCLRIRFRQSRYFLRHDDDEPRTSSRSNDDRSSEETMERRRVRSLEATATAEKAESSVEVEGHLAYTCLLRRRVRIHYLEPRSSFGTILLVSLLPHLHTPPSPRSFPSSNRLPGYLVLFFILAPARNLLIEPNSTSRTFLFPRPGNRSRFFGSS